MRLELKKGLEFCFSNKLKQTFTHPLPVFPAFGPLLPILKEHL
jgi:hypothetical protein